ncbi:MAG: D-sedoheptulose 7-phosphate isomerase [Nitrospirae bacterium]|nr:D-sedoheptulose 7-phosphate isomerase [Nitrospirota bacterium]
MREKILKAFEESVSVKQQFVNENINTIIEVSRIIADSFSKGCKLLLFGNGGSSTDASHIAAEFVNRFMKDRPPFPAIALNTDMAVITSIANDSDYSEIFARQLKALAQEGDVVIAISTSGSSPNVLKAIDVAKKKKLKTIAFTGAKGDKLASKADYIFVVPSASTPRIQETHITLAHVLCQMVEELLLESHRKK